MESEVSFSLDRAVTAVETIATVTDPRDSSGEDDGARAPPSISSVKPVRSFQIASSDDEATQQTGEKTKRPARRRRPQKKGGLRANQGQGAGAGTGQGQQNGGPTQPRRRRTDLDNGKKSTFDLIRGPNVPGPCSYCTRATTVHYRKPYHEYIRKLTVQGWPYLKRLDTFMNFAEHFNKRGQPIVVKQRWRSKLRLTVLDYCDTGVVTAETFDNTILLRDYMAMERPEQVKGRLFLMEDLSRDAIEYLGGALDVEPDFWEGHINGTAKFSGANYVYGPYSTRVKFPPRLLSKQKRHGHWRIDYTTFRTNQDPDDPIGAQANDFNIRRWSEKIEEPIRNFDAAQFRQQIWTDQRVSILMMPHGKDGWTGIIVFDPSFSDSSDPSPWKSRGFAEYPSFQEQSPASHVFSNGRSDYEDFISLQLNDRSPEQIRAAISDSYYAVHELFLLIASQWTSCSSSIWVQLATLEERIQKNVGGDLEVILSVHVNDLLRWLTQVESYHLMVKLAIRQLKSGGNRDGWRQADYTSELHKNVSVMEKDIVEEFERLMGEMSEFKDRIERNLALFNASLTIEESKKAIKESESVSRLTKLAFIFIPLSYIASLLSIQGPGAPGSSSFWIYWAVSLPLTLLTFFAATILNWFVATFGHYFHIAYWRKSTAPASISTASRPRKKGVRFWLLSHTPWKKDSETLHSVEDGSLRRRFTNTESMFSRQTTEPDLALVDSKADLKIEYSHQT